MIRSWSAGVALCDKLLQYECVIDDKARVNMSTEAYNGSKLIIVGGLSGRSVDYFNSLEKALREHFRKKEEEDYCWYEILNDRSLSKSERLIRSKEAKIRKRNALINMLSRLLGFFRYLLSSTLILKCSRIFNLDLLYKIIEFAYDQFAKPLSSTIKLELTPDLYQGNKERGDLQWQQVFA